MGQLVVEVKEQRLKSLAEVNNPQLRQRLLAAVGELISFVGGYEQLVDAGVAPPASSGAAGADVAAPTTPADDENLTPAQKEELARRRARFIAQMEAERDSYRKSESEEIAASDETVVAPPSRPKTLVEQIDEVLQKHVAADPELAGRAVHLRQSDAQGMRIEVDGRLYDRPREIDDKRVQIAIKRALKEWENR
jgi:hypothetical protein